MTNLENEPNAIQCLTAPIFLKFYRKKGQTSGHIYGFSQQLHRSSNSSILLPDSRIDASSLYNTTHASYTKLNKADSVAVWWYALLTSAQSTRTTFAFVLAWTERSNHEYASVAAHSCLTHKHSSQNPFVEDQFGCSKQNVQLYQRSYKLNLTEMCMKEQYFRMLVFLAYCLSGPSH